MTARALTTRLLITGGKVADKFYSVIIILRPRLPGVLKNSGLVRRTLKIKKNGNRIHRHLVSRIATNHVTRNHAQCRQQRVDAQWRLHTHETTCTTRRSQCRRTVQDERERWDLDRSIVAQRVSTLPWRLIFNLFVSTEVRVPLTTDYNKIAKNLQLVEPKDEVKFITGIRIAHVSWWGRVQSFEVFFSSQLVLKHRLNRNHRTRIIVFIASPISDDIKEVCGKFPLFCQPFFALSISLDGKTGQAIEEGKDPRGHC